MGTDILLGLGLGSAMDSNRIMIMFASYVVAPGAVGATTSAYAEELTPAAAVSEIVGGVANEFRHAQPGSRLDVPAGGSTLSVHIAGPVGQVQGAAEYVIQDAGDRTTHAVYSHLADENAPTDHRYVFTVDGAPATVTPIENGFIAVILPRTGETVNLISPAWPVDANGAQLATDYTVQGNSLIQNVDTEGAAVPVVADPALACNGIHCTVQYTCGETRQITLYAGTAAAMIATGCGMFAGVVGGIACSIVAGYFMSVAADAYDQGKCVGIQPLIYAPAPCPVIYSGDNCV